MFTATIFASAAGIMSGLFAVAILGAVVVVLLLRRFRGPVAASYSEVFEPAYTSVPVPPIVFVGMLTDGKGFPIPPVERAEEPRGGAFAERANGPGEGLTADRAAALASRIGLSNCAVADCVPCGRAVPRENFSLIVNPADEGARLLRAAPEEPEVIEGEIVLDEAPTEGEVIAAIGSVLGSALALSKAPEVDYSPAAGTSLPDGDYRCEVTFVPADRKVASVDVLTPAHITVRQGEPGPSLSAVALNAAGQAVKGARIKFRSTNPERLFVNQKTGAVAGQSAGYASVFAVCQGVESARVRVRVR